MDGRKLPPIPGPWVQVAFTHPEWGERSGRYRRDVRGPGSAGQSWEIEVRSSAPGELVTLDLADVIAPTNELAVSLIDREQGSSVDWSSQSRSVASSDVAGSLSSGAARTYRIVSLGSRTYRLAILAGTPEYVAHAIGQALEIPRLVELDQNAPNPFSGMTRIRFGLPAPGPVTLEVFNVLGQRVASLLERAALKAGYHTVLWDGVNALEHPAPSGVYYLRLATAGRSFTKRIVIVK